MRHCGDGVTVVMPDVVNAFTINSRMMLKGQWI